MDVQEQIQRTMAEEIERERTRQPRKLVKRPKTEDSNQSYGSVHVMDEKEIEELSLMGRRVEISTAEGQRRMHELMFGPREKRVNKARDIFDQEEIENAFKFLESSGSLDVLTNFQFQKVDGVDSLIDLLESNKPPAPKLPCDMNLFGNSDNDLSHLISRRFAPKTERKREAIEEPLECEGRVMTDLLELVETDEDLKNLRRKARASRRESTLGDLLVKDPLFKYMPPQPVKRKPSAEDLRRQQLNKLFKKGVLSQDEISFEIEPSLNELIEPTGLGDIEVFATEDLNCAEHVNRDDIYATNDLVSSSFFIEA